MKISDIRIKLIESTGKLKAIAAVTIDGCFVVHDIKILQGTDSLFIAMPSRKAVDGTYKDIVHPLNTGNEGIYESHYFRGLCRRFDRHRINRPYFYAAFYSF